MVQKIAENEEAFILLNDYSFLMTETYLRQPKCMGFFSRPQSRYKPSSNYRVNFQC